MSYLWKKHGDMEPTTQNSIEKMNSFRNAFQNQVAIECQTYDGGMSLPGKVNKRKQKRFRSAFTTMQIALLEKEFKKDPYVTNARREQVAVSLNLPERAVKIWFQNRRMKEKRDSCKSYFSEDLDSKGNVNAPDETIKKISEPTNQQTTSTSLAAKIVFSDDTVQVTKNGDSHVTRIHVTPVYGEKKTGIVPEIKMEKDKIPSPPTTKLESTSKISMERLGNYRINRTSITSSEKPSPPKPTVSVGHVLPFSQVPTEPQGSPQNLSTAAISSRPIQVQENVQSDVKFSDLVPPYSSFPVDLSKYYTSVPPVPHLPWNGINYVPVLPGSQGVPYFGSPQSVPTATGNLGSVKNCSCDCHSSSFEALRAPHPMFYAPYVPHFITSLPTDNTSNKY